jgi:hypothetical protein
LRHSQLCREWVVVIGSCDRTARSVDETSYKGLLHNRKMTVIKGSLFRGCILSELSKCGVS